MLYPEGHPYSRPSAGSWETVAPLTVNDLREFHAGCYSAAGMTVAVAGAVDADLVRGRLQRWFAGTPPVGRMGDGSDHPHTHPPATRVPATHPHTGVSWRITPSGEPRRESISMPHKSQVDLILAGPGIPREHPDFFALSMVTMILGSLGLMGRLGERVREREGMAYYVGSRSVSRLWAGEWVASAGVAPQNLDAVVAAILEEVDRIREAPVTEEELADARDHLIGSLPLRMETGDGIAAYLLNTEYYGLGLDYVLRYPDYIRAETRASLQAAAARHVDPARFSLVAAGPV
jgi:zinc protease